jgi:hypothetical protein
LSVSRTYPVNKSGSSIGSHFKGLGAWNDNLYVNWDVYDALGNLLYVLPLYGDEPVLPNQEKALAENNQYVILGLVAVAGFLFYQAIKK